MYIKIVHVLQNNIYHISTFKINFVLPHPFLPPHPHTLEHPCPNTHSTHVPTTKFNKITFTLRHRVHNRLYSSEHYSKIKYLYWCYFQSYFYKSKVQYCLVKVFFYVSYRFLSLWLLRVGPIAYSRVYFLEATRYSWRSKKVIEVCSFFKHLSFLYIWRELWHIFLLFLFNWH